MQSGTRSHSEPGFDLSRRAILAAGGALAAAALLPGSALARASASLSRRAASPFTWTELKPGAWLVSGGGGNALLHGGVLLDSKNAGLGDQLRREAAGRGRISPDFAICLFCGWIRKSLIIKLRIPAFH